MDAAQQNLKANLNVLWIESGTTKERFAADIRLSRTVVSRLLNGSRTANAQHLAAIAAYCGLDLDDLQLEPTQFRKIYQFKSTKKRYMFQALQCIEENINRCKEILPKYKGQFIVYTNVSNEGRVNASLLEIKGIVKHGIEFTMINPYRGVGETYNAFQYRGYLMPVSEYLYMIGEQADGSYEILTMIFHSSGLPQAEMMEGLWAGIGVKDDTRYIASVPAVAVRRKKRIEHWRDELERVLGYVKTDTLDERIRRRVRTDGFKISSNP